MMLFKVMRVILHHRGGTIPPGCKMRFPSTDEKGRKPDLIFKKSAAVAMGMIYNVYTFCIQTSKQLKSYVLHFTYKARAKSLLT